MQALRYCQYMAIRSACQSAAGNKSIFDWGRKFAKLAVEPTSLLASCRWAAFAHSQVILIEAMSSGIERVLRFYLQQRPASGRTLPFSGDANGNWGTMRSALRGLRCNGLLDGDWHSAFNSSPGNQLIVGWNSKPM